LKKDFYGRSQERNAIVEASTSSEDLDQVVPENQVLQKFAWSRFFLQGEFFQLV
jgi:hypothetical protein